eukprot:Hpha_TRINITY_DN28374_c0_g1::TRINITY_DN28374_c0_g1_i1::g.2221::m.2221
MHSFRRLKVAVTWRCPACSTVAPSPEQFAQHVLTAHSDGTYILTTAKKKKKRARGRSVAAPTLSEAHADPMPAMISGRDVQSRKGQISSEELRAFQNRFLPSSTS